MNCSVVGLTVASLLSNSPLLTKVNSVRQVKFSFFFSPFLFAHPTDSLSVASSSFSHGLSNAINIDSVNTITAHQEYSESVTVRDCFFLNIRNTKSMGGAIRMAARSSVLVILESKFVNCSTTKLETWTWRNNCGGGGFAAAVDHIEMNRNILQHCCIPISTMATGPAQYSYCSSESHVNSTVYLSNGHGPELDLFAFDSGQLAGRCLNSTLNHCDGGWLFGYVSRVPSCSISFSTVCSCTGKSIIGSDSIPNYTMEYINVVNNTVGSNGLFQGSPVTAATNYFVTHGYFKDNTADTLSGCTVTLTECICDRSFSGFKTVGGEFNVKDVETYAQDCMGTLEFTLISSSDPLFVLLLVYMLL